MFVDRVEESAALVKALDAHSRRMVSDEIDGRVLHHVITYYGAGGMGKSELSMRLSDWIQNSTYDAEWGAPPPTPVAAVGRWELNDSEGGVDAYTLLLELRRAFGDVKRNWPAFDLVFAALTHALGRDEDVSLCRLKETGRGWTVREVVQGAISDAATLADVSGAGVASAGVSLIANAVVRQRQSLQTKRLLHDWSRYGLADLLRDCVRASGATSEVTDLARRTAYLLSVEVNQVSPEKRPLVVMFVDHFERLQGPTRSGEETIHGLISALPYVLFVITGRNPLRWADGSLTALKPAGAMAWPGLVLSEPPPSDPRQHLVGRLPTADAEEMLRARLQQVGAKVSDQTIERLAEDAEGWPLHLEAFVSLAEQQSRTEELPYEALGGPLPDVVNRILRDLAPEERRIFQAGCLMPYFDASLLARAAGAEVGAARRFANRTIVMDNPGSRYPHKIHDGIREIVRRTGHLAEGGFDSADWQACAQRALDEASRRFDGALEVQDDLAATQALALALNVCAEHGLFQGWLVGALHRAPTLRGLSALIPRSLADDRQSELASLLAFVRASELGSPAERASAMEQIEMSGSLIAGDAARWTAYSLRDAGRWDEAIAKFEHILETYDDRVPLYRMQLVMTYVMARRYRTALDKCDLLAPASKAQLESTVRWRHGLFEGVDEAITSRLERASSRRFQVELEGTRVRLRQQAGTITCDDIDRVTEIARSTGHLRTLALVAGVRAQQDLLDDNAVAAAVQEMEAIDQVRGSVSLTRCETLALHYMATGVPDHLNRAFEVFSQAGITRGSEWVGVEFLLESLGRPILPTPGTQWLEAEGTVRERWLGIYSSIVQRSGNSPR